MLPTSAELNQRPPGPVGRRVQLSHERLSVKWPSEDGGVNINTNSRYILIRYIYSAVVHYKYAIALNAKAGTGKRNSTFLTFTGLPSFKNGLECDYPRSTTERSEGPTERSEGVC